MIEQIASSEFITLLLLKFDFLLKAAENYLSGANNLKVVSLALMLLALILFLCLLIAIYIRNIIYFVKSNNPAKNMEDNEAKQAILEEEDRQELERELQKELDMAIAERQEMMRRAEEEQKQKEQEQAKQQKDEQKKLKKDKEEPDKKKEELVKGKGKDLGIGFDWQKGKIPPAELAATSNVSEVSLSYKQSCKQLSDLMGLVIDMLGRGVDDLKIAQTINYKNQGLQDENEILKSIDAVKYFISLCVSGRFSNLENYKDLPGEEQALYNLAAGDPSLALALLESLMDTNIDKANSIASEKKRQQMYVEVSAYACCFGALAELNDVMLATSAYELAIELQSSNVVAWSRLGDVYKKANAMPKAAWAYQNVLNFADGEIDIAEVANANRHLSEHLYAEGNSLQAAKLYNNAKQYYDSLGINRRLDRQELEILDIIENNCQTSLPESIKKLLGGGEKSRN